MAHLAGRLGQLYAGLVLYGFSMALLLRAELGAMPWDVLHQGTAGRSGLSIGVVSIVVGAMVLLLWWPLRERPGVGTVSNVVVIGLAVDGSLAVVGPVEHPVARGLFVVVGIGLNAVATAAYIGVRLGAGPRDGLMTGLVRRTGRSVRLVRTSIEVVVVLTGWLLGGTLGVATVLYALAIGPLVQRLLPIFELGSQPRSRSAKIRSPRRGDRPWQTSSRGAASAGTASTGSSRPERSATSSRRPTKKATSSTGRSGPSG